MLLHGPRAMAHMGGARALLFLLNERRLLFCAAACPPETWRRRYGGAQTCDDASKEKLGAWRYNKQQA